jgi:hypothetical protein
VRAILLSVLLAAGRAPQEKPAVGAVDFVRDVQPILAKRCHSCHGPEKQKNGLRLDVKAAALRGGDGGAVIRPREAAKSPLIARVTSRNSEERMPPKGDPLAAAEVDVLRRWIDAGAPWPDAASGDAGRVTSAHWAFQPVRRPAVPAVKDAGRVRNPIDAFVLARLEKEGRGFSPPAERAALARRLSLDLVGLPPSPAAADAFVRDMSPDAYERYVDSLLASPHYGERWARRWLDLARYADTNGYEKDRNRSIWPWRDWVIRALNDDLPFDRFTIEQIAGDLLPDATIGSRVATGFHRNTMINEEGGIDVEEFRFESIVDRVGTTATVWLGLSMACAQCHSHKFDPLTQREYYGLFAFLNNADEIETPVPDPDIEKRRAEAAGKIAAIEAGMDARFDGLRESFVKWREDAKARSHRWTPVVPDKVEGKKGGTFTPLPDASVLVSGDNPNNNAYTVTFKAKKPMTALRLEVLPHESLPDGGPGRAPLFSVGDFLLSEVKLEGVPFQTASHSYAENNRSAAQALDGRLDTGWSIKGRTGQAHHAVFVPSRPVEGPVTLTLVQEYIHQMTIGRFRVSVTSDAPPVESSGLPAEVEVALSTEDEAVLRRHFLATCPELAEEQKKIAELRKSMPKHPTTMVMAERRLEHARRTHLHHRGQFLQPREEVEPCVPAVLHPFPSDAPRNRLGLARWLVDGKNPLVGRVIMNRQWQAFFGRGIVSTLENFGTQGARPTHPELLDWLASEFVERRWSMKAMHRLIVTSETYRQSSRAAAGLLARDPENLLLGRASRFRLEAELVRDGALAASGLLNPKVGGPSVYPPQPEGVTELAYGQPKWPASQGPDRYRRGLYTFAKRTAPYAAFATFDGPSGECCAPRRDRSNTPLQALNVLNDIVFLEAARALAKASMSEADPLGAMFRRCLTRAPSEAERGRLLAFREKQLARPLDAAALTGARDGTPEFASWVAVARVMLNLDEMITRE